MQCTAKQSISADAQAEHQCIAVCDGASVSAGRAEHQCNTPQSRAPVQTCSKVSMQCHLRQSISAGSADAQAERNLLTLRRHGFQSFNCKFLLCITIVDINIIIITVISDIIIYRLCQLHNTLHLSISETRNLVRIERVTFTVGYEGCRFTCVESLSLGDFQHMCGCLTPSSWARFGPREKSLLMFPKE